MEAGLFRTISTQPEKAPLSQEEMDKSYERVNKMFQELPARKEANLQLTVTNTLAKIASDLETAPNAAEQLDISVQTSVPVVFNSDTKRYSLAPNAREFVESTLRNCRRY
jgi:hypothetical protein